MAPFATVGLGFRTALAVQGGMLLVLTLVAGIVAVRQRGWLSRLLAAPRPLLMGVSCYALAGLLGATVGLARGNAPSLLAGQLLSMGLLPVAAVAGVALGGGTPWRAYAFGVSWGVAGGALVHVVVWAHGLSQARVLGRFFLPNNVAMAGPALLALLAALALALGSAERARRWAWAACGLIGVYIVGAGVRSLWLVSLGSLMLFLLLSGRIRWLLRPAALTTACAVAAVLIGGALALRHWWLKPRPDLILPKSWTVNGARLPPVAEPAAGGDPCVGAWPALVWTPETDRSFLELSESVSVTSTSEGWYRLRGRVRGPGHGWVYLVVTWFDHDGRRVAELGGYGGGAGGWQEIEAAGPRPASASHARIGATASTGGDRWEILSVRLEPLGSPALSFLCDGARRLIVRPTVLAAADQVTHGADPSLSFRLAESLQLWRLIRSRSVLVNLAGQGLGAQFPFASFVADDRGGFVVSSQTNYIHNFYMFLLFKLGIVGTLLVLTALCTWLLWTLRAARSAPSGASRYFLAAAGAAWVGYCVWSTVCPEILDPRMAPLWGLLLAATAACSGAVTSHATNSETG